MKKVAIIGAGISGLYLANLLEKEIDLNIRFLKNVQNLI